MGGTRNRRGGLGAALAMLALVLQICAPSGFMISDAGGAPALVVCTGHGALVSLPDDHGQPGKAPASRDHGVCAFAGHGLTTLGEPGMVLATNSVAFEAPPAAPPADPAPGRGLAAPPPPSQAPPLRTI